MPGRRLAAQSRAGRASVPKMLVKCAVFTCISKGKCLKYILASVNCREMLKL